MGDTLVVHTGGIGDFLLACPSIAQLARSGPIDLLGRCERLALAVEGGTARTAYSLESVEFHTVFSDPSPRLSKFLAKYSRVVAWMNDGDGGVRRGMARCGVERADAFPGLPPDTWDQHASDYYLSKLDLPKGAPFQLRFAPTGNHEVLIHPGSGAPAKNGPIEKFLAIAEHLEREGRRVEWLAGPAEHERGVALRLPSVLPRAPLTEVARRLAGAKLYIGNDSGITHLAAAVGCPAIALFGATDPRVWGPRGGRVQVLGGPGRWPSMDDVIAACETTLSG